MNAAAERLQASSHKLAEVMYRSASQAAPGAGPGPSSGSGPAKEDEVIDTEYVDAEKK
jgi:molecular chaperone DnaK